MWKESTAGLIGPDPGLICPGNGHGRAIGYEQESSAQRGWNNLSSRQASDSMSVEGKVRRQTWVIYLFILYPGRTIGSASGGRVYHLVGSSM